MEYVLGDVEKEKEKPVENDVEHRLVLVSRGGYTTRGNDEEKELSAQERTHVEGCSRARGPSK